MNAYWTAIVAASALVCLLTGLITLTEKGHDCWRRLINYMGFWRNLKKRSEELEARIKELEAPPKPRTLDQQMCPHCGVRGKKTTNYARHAQTGRHFCWYRCEACNDNWQVWID